MKQFLAATSFAALIAAPSMGAAQTNLFGPLLTPAEFAALQPTANALVLDIRVSDGDNKAADYDAGHIAGAIHAPYGLFRGPKENPGAVPSADKLTEVLRGLGVTHDRPTLIVHQGKDETDFGAAARVYWTLKSSGVSQLAILNGGMNAWTEAKLDLSTVPGVAQPSDITVTLADDWLATTDDILQVVEGKDSARLVDSRPESFWAGEQAHGAAARPGTLPQSEFFTHSRWFGTTPSKIDVDTVKRLAAEAGYTNADAPLVSFCNTGHWAATNWFALSELAGVEQVKLYPDSMVGWSQAGLPMDNVPGPIRNLWNQITSVF